MGSSVPGGGLAPKRGGAASRFGTPDVLAARARELHEAAAEAERRAAELRAQRDQLILRLRSEDERRWSYGALAKAIGCSRELIAQVVRRGGTPRDISETGEARRP